MKTTSALTVDPSRPRAITLLLLCVLVLGASAAVMIVVPEGITQFGLLLLLLAPAVMMSIMDSGYLMPYILIVWTIAPALRRLTDWSLGTYQTTSLVTLAPLLVTATLAIPLLSHPIVLTPRWRKILFSFGAALMYAAAVGVVRNGFSFLYDFGNYVIPLLIVFYVFSRPAAHRERDRYLNALVVAAVLMSVYGWVQYLTVPPWDAFWMKHAGMGSIGKPIPLKIRVFSTLNSPGSAAIYLSTALGLMFSLKQWRNTLGWVAMGLVASALILTMVRISWLTLVVFILVVIATSPSSQRLRSGVMVVVAAILLVLAIPFLPGAQGISKRFQSFTALDQDRSYTTRREIAGNLLSTAISNPIGKGIGGVGMGLKLSGSGAREEDAIIDNGVISLLKTFGLVGILLFFRALWLIFSTIRKEAGSGRGWDIYLRLAMAGLVSITATLASSSNFSGLGAVLLWLLVALAFTEPPADATFPGNGLTTTATEGIV